MEIAKKFFAQFVSQGGERLINDGWEFWVHSFDGFEPLARNANCRFREDAPPVFCLLTFPVF
jgi:hypothetical protein